MNTLSKGAAKRLIFSLALLYTLGGCAVYPASGPYGAPYAYGTAANGQAVYAAPPVYAAPGYAANPYYYDPRYIGPPVFLNFGYQPWGGYRGFSPAFRGGYRGGHKGGFHGVPGRRH